MYEFRPAVRTKTSVIIALAGASGSGKTMTAMLLAVGLAYPGMKDSEIVETLEREKRSRICMIDTEGGRGLHYAPGTGQLPDFRSSFPFEYGEIVAPYTPEAYQEAMEAADKAGFAVIIIDSASHEYDGEGGIMEIADTLEAGVLKPGKTLEDAADPQNGWKCWAVKPVKSPGNWSEPKTRHKKMVNRAVQLRAHVIFCLRAEEKMLLRRVKKTNSQGNEYTVTEVVPAEDRPLLERWQPICEKRFMYEQTVSFLLLPSAPGVGHPIKNLQAQFEPMFPEGQQLGRANGELLAAWAAGATPGARTATSENRRPTRSEDPDQSIGAGEPPGRGAASGTLDKAAQRKQQVEAYEAGLERCLSVDELTDYQNDPQRMKWFGTVREHYPELYQRVIEADRANLRRVEDLEAR